jgi:hypothetical protein
MEELFDFSRYCEENPDFLRKSRYVQIRRLRTARASSASVAVANPYTAATFSNPTHNFLLRPRLPTPPQFEEQEVQFLSPQELYLTPEYAGFSSSQSFLPQRFELQPRLLLLQKLNLRLFLLQKLQLRVPFPRMRMTDQRFDSSWAVAKGGLFAREQYILLVIHLPLH